MKDGESPPGYTEPPTQRNNLPHRKWGAHVDPHGVEYTVWAPDREQITVEIRRADGAVLRSIPLLRDHEGFHRARDAQGRAGDRYRLRIAGQLLPDPASRGQVGTVHDDSLVVDANAFHWSDRAWKRPAFRDLIIYELHVGTFTLEGTFRGVIEKIPYLVSLGVNAIEIMPVADFPGDRNWGYDGVLIYAPARAYGTPDDFRALIEAAHHHGIAVILDVVYNHFGPDGNYLGQYSRHFFSNHHHTPWGQGFNFDGDHSAPVREFFLSNVIYWMEDFHMDGFRFDATHEIIDDSSRHILAEMTDAIHAHGCYAIAEDERNDVQMLTPTGEGGCGFDAVWADDFHHIARVIQTQEKEGYYRNYHGTLAELIDTLENGWHYRGLIPTPAGRIRGTPCNLCPPSQFLHCISNHDQVGNRAHGRRGHEEMSTEAYRALSMLLCLTPYTPMLFMGQEWAATTPFLFFTDHHADLGAQITAGRRKEFAAFEAFRDPALRELIPDPQAASTFLASKLDWTEAERAAGASVLTLYRECLALRQQIKAFRPRLRDTWRVQKFGEGVGAIEWVEEDESYLLLFDLKSGYSAALGGLHGAAGDPLRWKPLASSNDERFGGPGSLAFDLSTQRCDFHRPEALLLQSERAGTRMDT